MQVEVVRKEGLKRELNIEVPADIVDQTFGKIYSQYRKQAKIKGFRPGKAPLNIIRSKFKNEVTAELIDELVKKFYGEAVREKKLEVVGNPVLSDVDVDEGKPFKFTIGVEVMPELDAVKFEGMTVKRGEVSVPDEEVEKVVQQLRQANAEMRSVTRPAGKDDVLICDLHINEADPEMFDQDTYKNQELDLGSEYTDKEFQDGLVGAGQDDTRKITINYPENYQNSKFAGKKAVFEVTIREIKEKVLPPLNDDFAKMTGEAETLLELKLKIRKQLEADARSDLTRGERKAVMDQLVDKNDIDVPESMITSYIQNVINDFKQNNVEFEENEVKERYHPVAIRAIRWFLLFHRLAVQEKIEVSDQDTENWIKRFAEKYRMDVPKAKEILARTNRQGEVKDSILEEKVIDFLMENAEIKKGGN